MEIPKNLLIVKFCHVLTVGHIPGIGLPGRRSTLVPGSSLSHRRRPHVAQGLRTLIGNSSAYSFIHSFIHSSAPIC